MAGFPWKDQRQQPVLRHRPSHKAFASKVQAVDGKARATHEVDGGLETVSLTLPAIITTDSRLNEPALRHAAQHHAKKKQLDIFTADLGVEVKPHLKTLK